MGSLLGVVLLAGLIGHKRNHGSAAVVPAALFRGRDVALDTAVIAVMGVLVAVMFIPVILSGPSVVVRAASSKRSR